ncbi:DEAD/DEAH box helicase [Burkholderiaceae bacterium FT117]|uniref:DEAD/DEAH box helicase n=1 Tax=Zeimonas sediminis TaxID=2944268 RepID=UPI002342E59F|nr:DEAD/DEAH box helicase [Zeimonas sediminis]MCM5570387.1 DEAD/DEAH box helicase [Zeimonas sediminis]
MSSTHLTTTFDSFGLAEPILRAVTELGYREPTPIQAQAIPIVLQGRDVMGAAQTGTGKTAGFALPILQLLMRHANTSASPARHPVRALILAPTRELADQIFENVRDYAKHTGLRAAVVFGGVDIKPQIAELKKGAEVLIATPGRLLDHVGQRTVSLAQAELLVLDEADRMLDMGFMPDIQRIINLLPKKRQNLMFSATFSGEIRKLAESFLHDPVSIEVARRNATAENVEQTIYRVADADSKRAAVAKLIKDRALSQVIVFTNTKIGAGRLARLLERDGLNAAAIHGDKTQQERLATLEAFKKGETSVLVATDVAARGLDIAELPAVINYDLPHNAEDYVHRIGRTGRAGASGVALSLMCGSNDERLLADIEKLTKRKFTPESIDVGPVEREPRPERGERPGRGERAARGGREEAPSRPRRSREGRADQRPAGPSLRDDPLFHQPYEPPEPPAATEAETELAAAAAEAGGHHGKGGRGSITGARRSRKPVAALLGGLGKR